MKTIKTSLRAVLGLAILLTIASAAISAIKPINGSVPIILSTNPTAANPGQQVVVRVYLSEITVDSGTMTISSVPGDWSSIPATVNVPAEVGYVEFNATLSSTTEETSTPIGATFNYGYVGGGLTINQ